MLVCAVATLGAPTSAAAQNTAATATITPIAGVEASYTYAFDGQGGRELAFRGFNNRHNTVLIESVIAGAAFELGAVSAKRLFERDTVTVGVTGWF
jgi:hypothetical protein